MKVTPFRIGFILVIIGGTITAYHLGHMLRNKGTNAWYRISMILAGGLFISMSANLFASTIHDKLSHKA